MIKYLIGVGFNSVFIGIVLASVASCVIVVATDISLEKKEKISYSKTNTESDTAEQDV